jgi:hypothetical protein
MDSSDLLTWAKEIVTDRVVRHKQEQERKKQEKKSRGYFGGFFGGSKEKTEE